MLAEVAVINTRPLTYVNSDFSSGFTLTPAHFLTDGLDTFIPGEDFGSPQDFERGIQQKSWLTTGGRVKYN